jgi:glycine/D-amino acid oxidase-like deaminating enzyme
VYLPGTPLVEITDDGPRPTLPDDTRSTFEADRIILATGIANAKIARMLGCELSLLHPLRGDF